MKPITVPTGCGDGTFEASSMVIAPHPEAAIASVSRIVFTEVSEAWSNSMAHSQRGASGLPRRRIQIHHSIAPIRGHSLERVHDFAVGGRFHRMRASGRIVPKR